MSLSRRLQIRTLLLIDQKVDVCVNRNDNHIGQNVARTNHVQNVWIIKRYSL
jgi:hypothetical protein